MTTASSRESAPSGPLAPSDLELMIAWSWGSVAAPREFYRRMFPAVNRYYANKVNDERDIEDLIQRTFLACMESAARFRAESSVRAWTLGIAHNLLCGHYRERARKGKQFDSALHSVCDAGEGPSTLLNRSGEQQVLLDALRDIPLDAQCILELYYWERMTGPELAEFLGVPEANVRSKLRRARDALRTRLGKSVGGPRELSDQRIDDWAAEVRAVVFATVDGG